MPESVPRADRPPPAYAGRVDHPVFGGCVTLLGALALHGIVAVIGAWLASWTVKTTEGTGWWPTSTSPLDPYLEEAALAWLAGAAAIVLLAFPIAAIPHRKPLQYAVPVGWLALAVLAAVIVLVA